MLSAVRRWFAKEPRTELIEVLGRAEIPSFQPSVLRILKLIRDPNSGNRQIGQAVMADPGLSIRVLRLVNSSAFGLRRKVDNVGHAAGLLGRTSLEELVVGLAVRQALPASPLAGPQFWRVSAQRAATARAIAEQIAPSSAPLCFSGGLLQDMALPLLANARPAYAATWRDEGLSTLVASEADRFGFTHAQVADWLSEAWGFPDGLRQAIGGHHGVGDAPVPVQLVALLGMMDDDPDQLVEIARDRFALNPDRLIGALAVGEERGAELAEALAR